MESANWSRTRNKEAVSKQRNMCVVIKVEEWVVRANPLVERCMYVSAHSKIHVAMWFQSDGASDADADADGVRMYMSDVVDLR